VQKLGRHWKDIQRHHFPGRSKNCIKNRSVISFPAQPCNKLTRAGPSSYTVIVRRYQNSGIPLPEGMPTPEPSTPGTRLSGYSTPDEDSMSYTSGIYDDILTTQTQGSTPEPHHSWPTLDEAPYTSWAPQESFNVTSGAAEAYPQQQQPNATSAAQWAWTTAPMESPAMMTAYAPGYPHQQIPYGSYNQIQGMLGPLSMPAPSSSAGNRSSYHGPPPTSSPRPPNSAPQEPGDVNRFMRYGAPGESPYRY
jgi:myb proto-oncogene protein